MKAPNPAKIRRMTKNLLTAVWTTCVALGIVTLAAQTGQPAQFPLAAPAGTDSNARAAAPTGASNQGPVDPATWKYGHAFDAPAGAKVWNPVKLKLAQGGKVTGGTLFSSTDPATYCAMANAGYDFIWT